ncbi:MAG: glycosyltransferase family 39 protein [Bacteroidales bacterium]|nr:glycosyltransferase family 39 protein [Bacteroidales bacterium]
MEEKPRIADSFLFKAALVFVLLLPVLLCRDLTPANEMKYLEIADEALRDGHFWCLFHNGEMYTDKPPLYIWIVMLFRTLLGRHCAFLLELFSLIPALVTIRVLERWCGKLLSARYRNAASLSLMTSAWFLGSAIVLRMDMLMTMFITLALWTFWKMYEGDTGLKNRLLFPLFVFLAVFSKGPVGIMVPLLCIPAFLLCERTLRFMGTVWGWLTWAVLALLCGIWWFFVWREGGDEYLNNLLFHQTAGRAVNAFHHKEPFYYYCYTVWYAAAPWVLIHIPVLVWALVKRVKLTASVRFFLVVSAAFFVIMSAVSGKLAVYLLPIFGPVCFASGMILQQMEEEHPKAARTLSGILVYGSLSILFFAFIVGLFFPDWLNSLL